MDKLVFATILVLSLHDKVAFGNVAPDYIHPCVGMKAECLKKTVQETLPKFAQGIPEFGIVPLDPLAVSSTLLKLPGGLTLQLNDGIVLGIKKCTIDSLTYSFENSNADFDFHCNITIKGKYKAAGTILILTINGDGDAKIKANNVKFRSKIKFADAVRNGIVYHEIKKLTVLHSFDDRVTFDLTNLFKGSPEISNVVLSFLNQNWKQIAEEFGSPIVENLIEQVKNNIMKFFQHIPKNELVIRE